MFPALHVQTYGLDPQAHYCVLLEMAPASRCRYKYSSSGGWSPAGAEEAQSPQRVYLHPDSPATGEYWMSQPVSFGKVKLTNSPAPPAGHLVLSSMHKYQPRIIVVKTSDPRATAWAPQTCAAFPETRFVAVTAYQNERITKLKIDNNPFAKGFRQNGHGKCKRKRDHEEDEKSSKEIRLERDGGNKAEEDLVSVCSSSSSSPSSIVSSSSEVQMSQTDSSKVRLGYSVPYASKTEFSPMMSIYPYYYSPYSIYTSSMWRVPYYYHPQTFQSTSCNNVYAEDLTVQVPKPKKLTDFSIRALLTSK